MCQAAHLLLVSALYLIQDGLCRLLSAPAGVRSFPTLSLHNLLWMNAPVPRWLPWCSCPFLPMGHRPSLSRQNESAFHNIPCSNFSTEPYFAVLGDFNLYLFNPPDLLTTRVAPTAVALSPPGSCGVYIQAGHVLLPPHELDMLAVRIGQLTARGLAPLQLRSLVGYSAFRWANGVGFHNNKRFRS